MSRRREAPAGGPLPSGASPKMSLPIGSLSVMCANISDIDLDSLEEMIGVDCYEAAAGYVRRQAVLKVLWAAERNELWGLVQGSYGKCYTPVVYFSRRGPALAVRGAQCSCHARRGCEHAAALLICAAQADGTGNVTPGQAAWDTSLESLLAIGLPEETTALAIELTLAASGDAPVRLMARLVQPGRNGGWIGGSLSWGKLDSYGEASGYSPTQVRLLRELLALYRSRRPSLGFRQFGYGEERAIELSAFESARLWPLLDEADAAGLHLVYARKLGSAGRPGYAELALDITRSESDGTLNVTPAIRVADGDGGTVVPVRFIGADGHGVVYLDRAEAGLGTDPAGWRFGLARLTRAVPAQLQNMALTGQRLVVPGTEQHRFRDEFYPRLRQMAILTSSDGSFTPPVVSDPTLILQASYGPGHDVVVNWMWEYQVDDSRFRVELHPALGETGYRDAGAERAILDSLPSDRLLGPALDPGPGSAAWTPPGSPPRCCPFSTASRGSP